ncbi:MAG: protein translocase subunit SecD [Methylophilaceae bacterium]
MNRYPLWKYIFIGLLLLLSALYSLPNLFGKSPAVQISALKSNKLDTALMVEVKTALKTAQLTSDAITLDTSSIKVRFANTDAQFKAKDILQKTLGDGYVVALNQVSRSPSWLNAIGAQPMYMGLDLRGGVHFLLQMDMKAVLDKTIEGYVGDIRGALRKERVAYSGVVRDGDKIKVRFDDAKELAKAQNVLRKNYPDLTVTSSESGTEKFLIATLSLPVQKALKESALKQNIHTLHNRVNEIGVAEPVIQQQGEDRIVVQLPGVQDTAQAKDILGRTATLQVRMVYAHTANIGARDYEPQKIEAALAGKVPAGTELLYGRIKDGKDGQGEPLLVEKQIVFSGDNLTSAEPSLDQQQGGSEISVRLDSKGAASMKLATREGIKRRMAVILIEKGKQEILTAPTIQSELSSSFVITGMENTQEAQDLALLMRAGALAAPMEIIEERTVGPSMGEENIKRGVHSTMYGFVAIALMMMAYYLVFGTVSVLSLGVNLLLLVAVLSMLQATLTLPGLAAIALTLGMAIDSNVLINERIREELHNGNSPQTAIATGYDRAFATILDSNVTTLIVGVMLFSFGSGPVRGFAIVHVLGILTSMFSAVVVSRGLVNLTYGYRRKITKLVIG